MNNKEIQKLKCFPRWIRHFSGSRKEALYQYRQMLADRVALRDYLKADSTVASRREVERFNRTWGNFLGVKSIDI